LSYTSSEYGAANAGRKSAPGSVALVNKVAASKPARTIRLHPVLTWMAAIEFSVVAVAAYIASLAYHHVILSSWPDAGKYIPAALLLATLFLLVSIGFRHFFAIQTQPSHLFLWNGVEAVAFSFSFFLSAMFLLKIAEDYSRGAFLFQIAGVSLAVLGTRAMLFSRLQLAIASGLVEARRVILIGDASRCSSLADRLRAAGILAIGSFAFPVPNEPRTQHGATHEAGTVVQPRRLSELVTLCRQLRPDDVVIAAARGDLPTAAELVKSLSELPVGVHIVPMDLSDLIAAAQVTEFGEIVTLQVSRPPLSALGRVTKRAFDILAAVAGVIVFSPLFLIVSLAIKLDSHGPVFFWQTRHGYNNDPIRVLKFRTMSSAAQKSNGFVQAVANDPRVTRIGRILRRTSIDELPQLFNVLAGTMSIVGPRPHATLHNEMFARKISPFARRHNVKPGITGWAQVNGHRGPTDTLEKMRRRIEYDLYYIDNWSLMFDIKIIIMTVFSKRAHINAY
jgi:Undecaprenyl-phosphate glucose phosphotransferase